jgi:hypothetical protein
MPTEEPTYCPTNSQDESIKSNTAPVQSVRFTLPKDARELIVAVILAASMLTNLWLFEKSFNAEKDRQTYQMLCADGLTKFEQGSFADVKARVMSLERDALKGELSEWNHHHQPSEEAGHVGHRP